MANNYCAKRRRVTVLKPIWTTKPETAGRLRVRIERVLSWVRTRGDRPSVLDCGSDQARCRHPYTGPLARVSLAPVRLLDSVSLGYQVNSFQRSPIIVFSLV